VGLFWYTTHTPDPHGAATSNPHYSCRNSNCDYAVLGMMCSGGISISKDDVMKPVRNNTLSVHQVTNRLKNCFEVVLLRLATQNDVECLVDILECTQYSNKLSNI